jgi:H+/Cl- antiporter ClcA
MNAAASIELLRMSKKSVTRLFLAAAVAFAVGLVLGVAAFSAALAGDAIDFGGGYVIEVHGGSGAWTALGLLLIGSLAVCVGTVAAVVSWCAALLNTWQRDEKTWFWSLLSLGLLGFGVVAMIGYVFAGPDGTRQRGPRVLSSAAPSS